MDAGNTEARRVVQHLGLAPHPEGGWFRETLRDAPAGGGRGALTHLYYLLAEGEASAWHRLIDATEVWHHYAGDPLVLLLSPDGRATTRQVLGADVLAGQEPHVAVPPGWWQAARPLGRWTLVGCTVAPAFLFERFEMAPAGWEPGA